jgi:putative transposase
LARYSILPDHCRTNWPVGFGFRRRCFTNGSGLCLRARQVCSNGAIHKFGPPDIMNTDQGSQFTSFAWSDRLWRSSVRIFPSHACKHALLRQWMDGKGRFMDNIFIEQLWRRMQDKCVYPHARETGSEARAGVKKWIGLYNHKRRHSTLGGRPSTVVYWHRKETIQPDQQVQRVA